MINYNFFKVYMLNFGSTQLYVNLIICVFLQFHSLSPALSNPIMIENHL